jgi:hypothetical protein
MQEKKSDFRTFLDRTNELANKLRIPLRELGPVMEMSTASLFGYRSGKIPLSNKAWGKLEAAERSAGIDAVVGDPPSQYRVKQEERPPPEQDIASKVVAIEEKLDRLIAVIADQAERIDALLEQRATSSPGHGRAVGSKPKKLV